MRKAKAGAWNKDHGGVRLTGVLSFVIYLMSRGGTTHSGLGSPTAVINKGNTDSTTGQSDDRRRLCHGDTKLTNILYPLVSSECNVLGSTVISTCLCTLGYTVCYPESIKLQL